MLVILFISMLLVEGALRYRERLNFDQFLSCVFADLITADGTYNYILGLLGEINCMLLTSNAFPSFLL